MPPGPISCMKLMAPFRSIAPYSSQSANPVALKMVALRAIKALGLTKSCLLPFCAAEWGALLFHQHPRGGTSFMLLCQCSCQAGRRRARHRQLQQLARRLLGIFWEWNREWRKQHPSGLREEPAPKTQSQFIVLLDELGAALCEASPRANRVLILGGFANSSAPVLHSG